MGRWSIHIEGTGAHHNSAVHGGRLSPEEAKKTDANEIGIEFLKALQDAGQNIHIATFIHGSSEPL